MRIADYSQKVTVDQLDSALRAGGFDGVMHYIAGDFALRIEDPAVVSGIRARSWPQAGIDVPRVPLSVDGAATARTAVAYGFVRGSRIYLDIEPGQFSLTPSDWPPAADGWCEAIRSGGFSPGVYGNDSTVAACSNHADTIWRAKPGMCDPMGPGLADTFFVGRRMVQCDFVADGGVSFDVSFSQFPLGPSVGGLAMAEGFMSPDPGSDVLQELFIGPDQTVYFADYGTGGAGGFNAYTGPIGSFGAPAGHKVLRVGGTYTQFEGQQRLNVWAVVEDGSRWIKVIRYVPPYDVLSDWSTTASPTLALTSPPSASAAYVVHTHKATTDGGTPS